MQANDFFDLKLYEHLRELGLSHANSCKLVDQFIDFVAPTDETLFRSFYMLVREEGWAVGNATKRANDFVAWWYEQKNPAPQEPVDEGS